MTAPLLLYEKNVCKQGHGRYAFPNHFAILIHSDSFSCVTFNSVQVAIYKVL